MCTLEKKNERQTHRDTQRDTQRDTHRDTQIGCECVIEEQFGRVSEKQHTQRATILSKHGRTVTCKIYTHTHIHTLTHTKHTHTISVRKRIYKIDKM